LAGGRLSLFCGPPGAGSGALPPVELLGQHKKNGGMRLTKKERALAVGEGVALG